MREYDLPAVLAIAAAVPTAPHWPLAEFSRMLDVIAREPTRRSAWVAREGSLVQGFAILSQAAGAAELEAVVTAPEWRRRGIGLQLLMAAISWSRSVGATRLQLEARESNGEALRLYARCGFASDGMRRGYYRNPEEDAVLLSLDLQAASRS